MAPGIDKSIAGIPVGEVLCAARHLADILTRLQHLMNSNERYELPDGFGAFVAADLAQAEADYPRGAPIERFKLAARRGEPRQGQPDELPAVPAPAPRPPGVHRWVDHRGKISLSRHHYHVGPNFAGEAVEVVCLGGLVDIFHAGVLVATHAERRPPKQRPTPMPRAVTRPGAPSGAQRHPLSGRQRLGQLRRHHLPGRPCLCPPASPRRPGGRLGAAVRRRQGRHGPRRSPRLGQ